MDRAEGPAVCPGEIAGIELVFSPGPRRVQRQTMAWRAGLTVAQAVHAIGWADLLADGTVTAVGVWGRRTTPDTLLQPGDRVELYRALQVDPKEARRQRYKAQGPRQRAVQPRRPRPDRIDPAARSER